MVERISFSQLGKHGRLGNQLFQIHSVMGLAGRLGARVSFPEWEYENSFHNPIPHGPIVGGLQIKEREFKYHEWDIPADADLLGYFQSEKYFGSFRLQFKDEVLDTMRAKYATLFEKQTICIQVRRGDYVGNPNYFQLPATFYFSALLAHFPDWLDYSLLVISDDIEYCKVHLGSLPNITFAEGNADIEDMALGSLCDHFIISNSSFGWWTAWFGEKEHSKVIHSGYMFAGALARKHSDADYRPQRWIAYRKDDYKLDLRDVTFTIPVHYDHPTRKENLDLSLYFLLSDLNTNIIIGEQGGERFSGVGQWAKYMRFDMPNFHRTKMLNDMAKAAQTRFIVNWDCDVMIPPVQLYMAVMELRKGADMVYPYGGPFARIPRNPYYETLNGARDIGVVRGEAFKGREAEHFSVGGAVMFDKDSFIDGGMENEAMVSFGPEDVERYERFTRLGYDLRRVNGCLFHLNHFVGDNSSPRNPMFADNEAELEKIRAMDNQGLREYVDGWGWRESVYSSAYYGEISEGAIRSSKIVMGILADMGIRPVSVVDVGCGVGEWNNGNEGYIGVDYRVNEKDLLISKDRFISANLNREFPKFDKRFDLALCLEVAEHLKPARAEALVEYLCSLSDMVLFSAAIPYQGGNGHINEQWQTYWARLFLKEEYTGVVIGEIRENKNVELWYRQNTVLYVKRESFEKRLWNFGGNVEDFVLPEYYMQIVKGLKHDV